jgi:hypothetical protein
MFGKEYHNSCVGHAKFGASLRQSNENAMWGIRLRTEAQLEEMVQI